MDLRQQLILDATTPALSEAQLRSLAIAAQDAHLGGLCVLPGRVRQASIMLARADMRVLTLIGYPSGVHTASVKGLETRLALEDGAGAIAVTPNAGYLGDEDLHLRNEIAYVAKAVREVVPQRARNIAVIAHANDLAPPDLLRLVALALHAGAHGVHLRYTHVVEPALIGNLIDDLRQQAGAAVPVTIHTLVPDATTARSLLGAGATDLLTPNAADL